MLDNVQGAQDCVRTCCEWLSKHCIIQVIELQIAGNASGATEEAHREAGVNVNREWVLR